MLDGDRIQDVQWIIDRSFLGRQPVPCSHLRQAFSDSKIRVLNIHSKFTIFEDDSISVLLLTSANLNTNKRVENIHLVTYPNVVDGYKRLVDDVFASQDVSAGFKDFKMATHTTKAVMSKNQTANPFELYRNPFKTVDFSKVGT